MSWGSGQAGSGMGIPVGLGNWQILWDWGIQAILWGWGVPEFHGGFLWDWGIWEILWYWGVPEIHGGFLWDWGIQEILWNWGHFLWDQAAPAVPGAVLFGIGPSLVPFPLGWGLFPLRRAPCLSLCPWDCVPPCPHPLGIGAIPAIPGAIPFGIGAFLGAMSIPLPDPPGMPIPVPVPS